MRAGASRRKKGRETWRCDEKEKALGVGGVGCGRAGREEGSVRTRTVVGGGRSIARDAGAP